MYYLFTECPDGDWELIVESSNLAYISKLKAKLDSQGFVTGVIGW